MKIIVGVHSYFNISYTIDSIVNQFFANNLGRFLASSKSGCNHYSSKSCQYFFVISHVYFPLNVHPPPPIGTLKLDERNYTIPLSANDTTPFPATTK